MFSPYRPLGCIGLDTHTKYRSSLVYCCTLSCGVHNSTRWKYLVDMLHAGGRRGGARGMNVAARNRDLVIIALRYVVSRTVPGIRYQVRVAAAYCLCNRGYREVAHSSTTTLLYLVLSLFTLPRTHVATLGASNSRPVLPE